MYLFEIAETQHLRRKEAASRLHPLPDAPADNNSVEFEGQPSHHRQRAHLVTRYGRAGGRRVVGAGRLGT